MSLPRRLIVNADDFGLSAGVNQGIIQAREQGIVTSASLMVRWPGAVEAAAYARANPGFAVGLHLDLCEWTFANEEWRVVYQVVPTDAAAAVEAEVARQLARFHQLVGRNPTHLDSHQHVHRAEPARSILLRQARQLGVPVRSEDPGVRYCGDFYGQSNKGYPYHEGITVAALVRIVQTLPAGTTELGCHPATVADMDSMYAAERLMECETLCDPRIRAALREEDVLLCSFLDLRGQGAEIRTR